MFILSISRVFKIFLTYGFAWRLRIRTIRREDPGDWFRQDLQPIRDNGAIILNTLEPPPWGVPTVIPGFASTVQQVRNEAMADTSSKGQDMMSAIVQEIREH